ncbi:Eco57I restriction-modification methylase domain-containing protein [Owenweeksia hongkongensis]|uniref:site-specific DNA-methyltransferase (adenine-specific) n=1 Tax=Owenweeksia hongkongensis (strain DSM 17368 / CIP 108786 / JCM 12287 / NRRL B-23963 / UST20020801) TaxID=926562 RepID=G8QZT7_OWEHD|nr:TaqI-like C-terminal specificity domain-containing protein [Owenweeksia hongkongensis]AEV31531.1 type I restriction-modification system methyltransferase subunit [Owenweeksia hongkongensis DSM 17368]
MSLFQNSVLKKYLSAQDKTHVKEAYAKFTTYFHNPEIQENIRNSKEEQFQEGFLRELFVNVLGYTINPNPGYNLTTELKNIKDAKKTDGAILSPSGGGATGGGGNSNSSKESGQTALAVIELKGTDTKDLDKVNDQAFNYKNNQPDCVYVITSNFEKLRFYIHNAVEHEEFNLFALSAERFSLLWLFLQKDNLLSGIPAKVKEESLLAEEKITKQLYADYSAFKQELWQDMVKQNPQHDELLLYKKSQKLLDRFLFIFFAEDKGLLPPNSISQIIGQWEKLTELDEYRPLYDRLKKYFGYMNSGHKGKAFEIHAYNGGLFADDELLDGLIINDELLKKHCRKLTEYDFESEVDTNILGHIFEHSLNEIENVRAQLEGTEIDKSKSKRKKDGVFYTPKYITKYIVDNTVGKLCEEKKQSIGIDDEEFAKDRKGRKKTTLKKLDAQLKEYREWLLQLTICDPACGSGAFLNQALEFLMAEHRYVDELEAQLLGYAFEFPGVENHILEKNIYGVDINEESVEIARLSLWLRTAKKGRKLNNLSSNIKVGNSLIDDSAVAGDLAFNWQNEFPQVFERGGFDVVIGNPPYLRVQGLRTNFEVESVFYEKNFDSATGRFDIYVLFIEKAYGLIKDTGKVSFILPHKFLVSDFGVGIRGFLTVNKAVEKIIHFGSEMVFADASTYTCILSLSNQNEVVEFKEIEPMLLFNPFSFNQMRVSDLSSDKWDLQGKDIFNIILKLKKQKHTVKDLFDWISQGIVSVGDDIFLMRGTIQGNSFIGYSDRLEANIELEAGAMKPLLKGEDVKKYSALSPSYYVLYPHYEKANKTVPLEEEDFQQKYPLAYKYMLPFKEELIEKKVRYKTNPRCWYSLHRSRDISLFQKTKIVTPETSFGGNMTIDEEGLLHNTQVYLLVDKNELEQDKKYLMAILNSSLLWFYLQNTGAVLRGGYFRFKTKYLEPFPMPLSNLEAQQSFISKVDLIMDKTRDLQTIQHTVLGFLQSKFSIEKPSKKLQNWPSLDFEGFLTELKKAKVKLSLAEEAEWMSYFNAQKDKANTLQAEINRIDKEIDQMVYELYGLTEEEIKIVENS